jgi:nicotinate-nucleotide adenylyltransferase
MKLDRRSVAIFGGSFNPPHVAHLLAVTLVIATEDVERLLVVPAFKHPFAKSLAPFDDRLTMCALAMGWLPKVEISRVEEELGGESRTLHTLEHLQRKHPDWAMRLVIGSDLVAESSKWFRFDLVSALAPPIILPRAGVASVPGSSVVLPAISSTEVRARLAQGGFRELQGLVPRAVLSHIRERGLYRSGTGEAPTLPSSGQEG